MWHYDLIRLYRNIQLMFCQSLKAGARMIAYGYSNLYFTCISNSNNNNNNKNNSQRIPPHILIQVSGMLKPGIVAQRSDLLTGDSGNGLAWPTVTTFRTYPPPGDGAHVMPHVLCNAGVRFPQIKCHQLWLRSAGWNYFGSYSWAPNRVWFQIPKKHNFQPNVVAKTLESPMPLVLQRFLKCSKPFLHLIGQANLSTPGCCFPSVISFKERSTPKMAASTRVAATRDVLKNLTF